MNRLAVIAALLRPCPPPDIAGGFDLCPCGYGGTWPCPVTRAAWIAQGLDPEAETGKVTAKAEAECQVPGWNLGGWDPDLRTCWTSTG
jgi:hypothetical protein